MYVGLGQGSPGLSGPEPPPYRVFRSPIDIVCVSDEIFLFVLCLYVFMDRKSVVTFGKSGLTALKL